MKQAGSIATFLVGLLFNSEDGSDMFLSIYYTVLYPTR
jgi:hypothetical protein